MAKSKYSEYLIRLQCKDCGRVNYFTRKNKKKHEEKLELKKFCAGCRGHKDHKERKK